MKVFRVTYQHEGFTDECHNSVVFAYDFEVKDLGFVGLWATPLSPTCVHCKVEPMILSRELIEVDVGAEVEDKKNDSR